MIRLINHLAFPLHLDANTLTFYKYFFLSLLYKFKGYCCAGLSMFGSSFNSFCIPNKICLTVMFGFQSYSSFNIDKHTVPDGYMFGCGNTGLNIHFGGRTGKSFEKSIDN